MREQVLCPISSGLAFEEKGISAVGNFLLARYHMYEAVYNHKVIVGFRLLLEKIHKLLVKQKLLDLFESNNVLQLDERNWFKYNDVYLLSEMMKKRYGFGEISQLIEQFFARKLLEIAASFPIYDRAELTNQYNKVKKLENESELEKLAGLSNISPNWLFYDEIDNELLDIKEQKSPLKVSEDGRSTNLAKLRPILSKIAVTECRIYTKDCYVSQVKEGIEEYLRP